MNWFIGQKVVCVENGTLPGQDPALPGPPLRKGATYVITGLEECKQCGTVSIDVGLYSDTDVLCDCSSRSADSIWWCSSKRFRPLVTKPDEQLERTFTLDEMLEELKIEVLEEV